MKKTIFSVSLIFLVFVFISCNKHISPASITDPTTITPSIGGSGLYTNTGKLKGQALFMSGTIIAETVYLYDGSGKIMEEYGSVFGIPSGDYTFRKYNSQGKLEMIDYPASMPTANDIFYSYDAVGRMTARYAVDNYSNTVDAMVFTYGTDGLINRIDESQNGNPSSYRLITRDTDGFITMEELYNPANSMMFGYINYMRILSSKTVIIEVYLLGDLMYRNIIGYDSDNFAMGQEITTFMLGTPVMTNDIDHVLQDGLFDPAGMNGYYYTDKDLFGFTCVYANISGVGTP